MILNIKALPFLMTGNTFPTEAGGLEFNSELSQVEPELQDLHMTTAIIKHCMNTETILRK